MACRLKESFSQAMAPMDVSSRACPAAKGTKSCDIERTEEGSSSQQNSTATKGITLVTLGANSDQFWGWPVNSDQRMVIVLKECSVSAIGPLAWLQFGAMVLTRFWSCQ